MTNEPTVPPVVGRKFRMRGGGVAEVKAFKGRFKVWPFSGKIEGFRGAWDLDGWHHRSQGPNDFDLVEMLP